MTFDEVIEKHRREIGAKRVHITLGPEVTPESLRKELKKLAASDREWYSFPKVLQLEAEIDQLHNRLKRLCDLSKTELAEFANESEEVRALKKAIFRETDIISMDRDEAISYCREKMNVFSRTIPVGESSVVHEVEGEGTKKV